MGILKLNELFKKCYSEPWNKNYDVVIIDGSNIIFQTLCSELSKLKKSGTLINQWQSVNLDLVSQLSYIVQYAIQDICETINKYYERGVKEVILVIERVVIAFVPLPINASPEVNVVTPVPPCPTGSVPNVGLPSCAVA